MLMNYSKPINKTVALIRPRSQKFNAILTIVYTESTQSNYNGVCKRITFLVLCAIILTLAPLLEDKNTMTFLPSWLHFGIDFSFKMRHCVNFYLNSCRNYETSKLKACSLLSESESFDFDLL